MSSAALACCMAAPAVETMGNTPISVNDLRNYLNEVLSSNELEYSYEHLLLIYFLKSIYLPLCALIA